MYCAHQVVSSLRGTLIIVGVNLFFLPSLTFAADVSTSADHGIAVHGNVESSTLINIQISSEEVNAKFEQIMVALEAQYQATPTPELKAIIELGRTRRASRGGNEAAARDAAASIIPLLALLSPKDVNTPLSEKLKRASEDASFGRFDDARQVFEEVRVTANHDASITRDAQAAAAFGLARIAEYDVDFISAVKYAKEASTISPTNAMYAAYASALLAFLDQREESLVFLRSAKDHVSEVVASEARAEVWSTIGDAFHDLEMPTDSIKAYKQALSTYPNVLNDSGLAARADTLQSLAATYQTISSFRQANEYYLEAWKAYKDLLARPKTKLLYVYTNMALFYLNAGCPSAAIEYTSLVLRQMHSFSERDPVIAAGLSIRGRAYFYNKEYQLGENDLREAIIRVASSFGPTHWRVGQYQLYLGERLFVQGNNEADHLLQLSQERFETGGGRPFFWYASALTAYARARVKAGDPAAPRFLEKAERYSAQISEAARPVLNARIALARAEMMAKTGNGDKTLGYVMQALKLDPTPWTRYILAGGFYDQALAGLINSAAGLAIRTILTRSMHEESTSLQR
jgi:tetratricopeptide (TPR) repeat protein